MLYQFTPPPRSYLLTKGLFSLLIALSLGTMTATAQIQNPFWIVPKGPTFQAVANTSATGPVIINLPSSGASPSARYLNTASNGWFLPCQSPLFFQVGDDVRDNTGVLRGVLSKKDQWMYTFHPLYNPFPATYETENFEVPIAPKPATNSTEFFIFYSNASTFGSEIWVSKYLSTTKVLTTPSSPLTSIADITVRFAVSKPNSGGTVYVYCLGNFGSLLRLSFNSSSIWPANITNIATIPNLSFVGAELELSHDQTKLAWSTGSKIGVFDLINNTYQAYEPFPGAFTKVEGLEWLPSGSLAAAIDWNGSYSFLDGICILGSGFSSFAFLSGSSAYKSAGLELGMTSSNTYPLFANNGTNLVGIQVVSGTPSFFGSPIPYSWGGLASPYSSAFHWVLPDQNDGDFYLSLSGCFGGGSSGTNKTVPDFTPDEEAPKFNSTRP